MGNCLEESKKREETMEFHNKLSTFLKTQGDKTFISFSGGKDSTALLIKCIEEGINFDEAVFADTGFEYKELYAFIDYVEEYIRNTYKGYEDFKITRLIPRKNLWSDWFYGKTTRGKHKGEVRGYPMVLWPCWYSREAKVKPLEKYYKENNAGLIYVGIAHDEKGRLKSKDERVKFPLDMWEMSEKDCSDYLQERGLHNPIYDNRNRSGCFHCQKQGLYSLYALWRDDKELWKEAVFWDNENIRIKGVSGFMDRKKQEPMPLVDLQKRFEDGFVPEDNLKYECQSCNVFSEHYNDE
jgi:3'-phosphoadenosine 5'-phosphosulfate sulfotransferase (PAPS reductase)/FAD synthetase